jgi:hypothetical protein
MQRVKVPMGMVKVKVQMPIQEDNSFFMFGVAKLVECGGGGD